MHILEDLAGLSSRAQDLLQRTGCCERPKLPRVPTDFLYVRDRAGRSVPAPLSLVVRREGLEQRYGGLRYNVRSTFTMAASGTIASHSGVTTWARACGPIQQEDGFSNGRGSRSPQPVWFAVHTDGRAGVTGDGTVFRQTAPSLTALIERHALTDMVSTWERSDPSEGSFVLASYIEGLAEVPEASDRTTRWRVSDCVAVQEVQYNSDQAPPGQWHASIWIRGDEGRRQLKAATAQAQR
jgi:hypothetical protein